MRRKPTVIDIFCGAGGFSYGFKEAGFNILLGIDSWDKAVETFKLNHREAEGITEDIHKVSVNNIKQRIGNKKIHVVIGGPPCQGFSMGGMRDPEDPRNSLFKQFVRVVDGIKPEVFVMENVRGILSLKLPSGQKTFGEQVINDFDNIGYETKLYVLNAANYGVAQKRIRVFFIGIRRKKWKIISAKEPDKTHDRNGDENLTKWIAVGEKLLPRKDVDKRHYYSEKLIKGFVRREKINKGKGRGFGWQILKPSKPSYTISARYWKDGAEALVRYSKKRIRKLTSLECARIQSFTDTYKFSGTEREVYTLIGNSVPPELARNIGESIKGYLP